jgi:lipid II:glycine glycyltransferase (peptidoglycan interpeptide bridge formation enzyme)
MRPATAAEIGRWDELVAANPDGGNILQSRAWGESKHAQGWRPRYLIGAAAGRDLAVLMLERRVPGLGRLWYSPKGPGVEDTGQLEALLAGPLEGELPQPFCIKVEPELHDTATNRNALRRAGCVKSDDVQIHRATVIVDLRPDEDALLASFKSKTRYNTRLAAKKGVTVRQVPCDDANTAMFFELYAQTARRAGFALRPQAYYTRYWRLLEASGQGSLFMAEHEGRPLAGVFAAHLGRKGWYKDGGSTTEHRELMAPHLLQWEVMRALRRQGVESYDLVAVPPRDQLDESHPLYGLWRFKSGFSEAITEYVGTWDLVRDVRRYRLWRRYAEPLALRLSWRLSGDLFY